MADLGDIRIKNWGLWLITGIAMLVIGFILLSTPVVTTFASVLAIGVLLIIGGLIHIVSAILDRRSTHLWLHLVIAGLALIFGFLMLFHPGVTVAALTLFIAAYFFSNGIFRIVGSLISRPEGWVWYLFNGIISFLLAILILLHWPASSLWVIGLFIGIDFIFAGITLVMTSLFYKRGSLLG